MSTQGRPDTPVVSLAGRWRVRPWRCVLISMLLLTAAACESNRFERFGGETMGTYFALTFERTEQCRPAVSAVQGVLDEVNAGMSTYIDDSELSRFNQSPADQWVTLSDDLARVVAAAQHVSEQTGGAFDVTVGPLVNLWGFGPERGRQAPSAEELAQQVRRVGMDKLDIQPHRARKRVEGVYVDLSALAKGFAVDRVAQLLQGQGCSNYMVDIGGEIAVAGVNAKGGPWRVGIEVPSAGSVGGVHRVLEVADVGIATSGDYRNYRVVDGRRVDHVLDPRSGQPADNHVVSATVVHPSTMLADAYATALMVLGWEEGFKFARSQGLPVYLIRRVSQLQEGAAGSSADGLAGGARWEVGAEDRFESGYTAGMRKYLVDLQ